MEAGEVVPRLHVQWLMLLAGLYQLNAAGSGAHALVALNGVDFHDTARKPNQDRAEGGAAFCDLLICHSG